MCNGTCELTSVARALIKFWRKIPGSGVSVVVVVQTGPSGHPFPPGNAGRVFSVDD